MWIRRFEVSGFKNFVEPVVLDDLGPINVIHGENNIGKSNLLDAMDLFFGILRSWLPGYRPGKANPFSPGNLADLGHPQQHVFGLQSTQPVDLSAGLECEPGEFDDAFWQGDAPVERIDLSITLTRVQQGYTFTAKVSLDGDIVTSEENHPKRNLGHRLVSAVTEVRLLYGGQRAHRFTVIDEQRGRRGAFKAPAAETPPQRAIVPQALATELFDASLSPDPLLYSRWELLSAMLLEAMPSLAPGRLIAGYDRRDNTATLYYEGPRGRLPIDQMGSSVQQVTALLGHALISGASLIAIEEPESNFRYSLQVRLRDVFRKLVAHPFGPRQLFITSHSPAFEVGDSFYAMRLVDGHPRIEKRPVSEAVAFTGFAPAVVPPTGTHARLGYVTSDRLVEVPEFVVSHLGIEGGGSVIFVERGEGEVEIMTHDRFLELFAGDGTEDGDGAER